MDEATRHETLPAPADSAVEGCPVFVYDGDRLIEILFSKWKQVGPGAWRLAEDFVFAPDEEIPQARFVFELPVGCFEFPVLTIHPGETVTFEYDESGGWMQQCEGGR